MHTGRRPTQPALRLAFSSSAFSASTTRIFEGPRRRVVFPAMAPGIPVFEVHYVYEPQRCEGEMREDEGGDEVEVFHLTARTRVGLNGPFRVGTEQSVPGLTRRMRATLAWVKGKTPGTAFLVMTRRTLSITHPCTGTPGDRSAGCQPQNECEREPSLVARVTAAGDDPDVDTLEVVRRTEPALSRVPAKASGSSRAACRRLGW
jgi:hypothetical protein